MEVAQIVMSAMWLQDAGSFSSGNSRLLEWFVGMVAIAMAVQAVAVIVLAVGLAKASKRADGGVFQTPPSARLVNPMAAVRARGHSTHCRSSSTRTSGR